MFLRGRPVSGPSRFSLLLLSDGEYYFEDHLALRTNVSAAGAAAGDTHGADYQAPAPTPGRLRVCSHSVVFEPDDVVSPVSQYKFESMSELVAVRGAVEADESAADRGSAEGGAAALEPQAEFPEPEAEEPVPLLEDAAADGVTAAGTEEGDEDDVAAQESGRGGRFGGKMKGMGGKMGKGARKGMGKGLSGMKTGMGKGASKGLSGMKSGMARAKEEAQGAKDKAKQGLNQAKEGLNQTKIGEKAGGLSSFSDKLSSRLVEGMSVSTICSPPPPTVGHRARGSRGRAVGNGAQRGTDAWTVVVAPPFLCRPQAVGAAAGNLSAAAGNLSERTGLSSVTAAVRTGLLGGEEEEDGRPITAVRLVCAAEVTMRPGGRHEAYAVAKEPATYEFTLLTAGRLSALWARLQSLREIMGPGGAGSQSWARPAPLQGLIDAHEEGMAFDMGHLVDPVSAQHNQHKTKTVASAPSSSRAFLALVAVCSVLRDWVHRRAGRCAHGCCCCCIGGRW
jgi:hypothetical protein